MRSCLEMHPIDIALEVFLFLPKKDIALEVCPKRHGHFSLAMCPCPTRVRHLDSPTFVGHLSDTISTCTTIDMCRIQIVKIQYRSNI